MNGLRWMLLVVVLSLLVPSLARAQDRGTIAGQVVGDRGQPLQGAQVQVQGTELRVVTGVEGRFRIPNVAPGQRVVSVSLLGYGTRTQTVTVGAGSEVPVNVTLSPTALALDELVVTGTAGATSRREQPAVVSTVNAAQLVETAPVTSVADILTARSPGVSVTSSSGSAGTAQQIRIRGNASISLSNEPLVFIDGVRADSRINGRGIGVGGQSTSRLNDINPEDIESIEVVKGPAAATLYGADASSGVIQIITKKGRQGAGRFSQSLTVEYHDIDPNFTPPDNFDLCTAAMVAPASINPLCRGQAVGTLIRDNPLVRDNAFQNGSLRSLAWSGRGGGDNYGYYVSFGSDDEQGTLPNNGYDRRTGRLNFTFNPTSTLTFEGRFGLSRVVNQLPDNDNNVYGYMGALLGSPLSRTEDGSGANGWFAANRNTRTIQTRENELLTWRTIPSIEVRFVPYTWFSHRLTVGADMSRNEATAFTPKSLIPVFSTTLDRGDINEVRTSYDQFTVDYLGTLRREFGSASQLATDLSFGLQATSERDAWVSANGNGLTTNAARVVGAASTRTGNQGYSLQRTLGYFTQLQLGYLDRLFVQVGARLDDASSFGNDAEPFLLPKVGASYVLSEESFWQNSLPWVNTLRLRAAYGTTGRSPTSGAALETYDPSPFAITTSSTGPGVLPLNPGNLNLKPERGTEFEGGLDAGFFNDRVGLEFTYFNKTSRDVLLRRPLPPSLGFTQNPFANIGEVVNRGIEVALNAQLVDSDRFSWGARLAMNTLHNEITDLGGIAPFNVTTAINRHAEGYQVGAFHLLRIRSIDTVTNRVVVSDTLEFAGNILPTYEGSLGSDITLFRNLRFAGQLDWKGGHKLLNLTDLFRETQLVRSDARLDPTKLSKHERLRRFGNETPGQPSFVKEGGGNATVSEVRDAYIQDASFVRLREISATYTLPRQFASTFRASGASITLAGRNLALWSDYEGADPEVISGIGAGNGVAVDQFLRQDFLTVPNPRRFVARVNFQF